MVQEVGRLKATGDEHIGIEDRELFPAAAKVLSEEEIWTSGERWRALAALKLSPGRQYPFKTVSFAAGPL